MGRCVDCGEYACVMYGSFGGVYLCNECHDKREQEQIIERSKSLTKCSDLKSWDRGDMSELFWIHLGRYVKNPNPESLKYINMAFLWAGHADHGLSNSFYNAMKWAGIDLYTETKRWKDD